MKFFSSKIRFLVPFLVLLFIGLVIGLPEDSDFGALFVTDAEAVVGRPITPVSYAGVARRTSRRVTRRHIAYGTRVTVLPVGYTTVVVSGTKYYVQDGVYYQPHYEGNNVVYVVVEQP
jgi:hypothetical protein